MRGGNIFIVITENGKAVGVVISPEAYEEIYTKRFIESVEQGLKDSVAGRVANTTEVKLAIDAARIVSKTKK